MVASHPQTSITELPMLRNLFLVNQTEGGRAVGPVHALVSSSRKKARVEDRLRRPWQATCPTRVPHQRVWPRGCIELLTHVGLGPAGDRLRRGDRREFTSRIFTKWGVELNETNEAGLRGRRGSCGRRTVKASGWRWLLGPGERPRWTGSP